MDQTVYYMVLYTDKKYNTVSITYGECHYPETSFSKICDAFEFTNCLENVFNLKTKGINLAIIEILDIDLIITENCNLFRSKRIFVKEIFDLLDLSTYDKLKIDIKLNLDLADCASGCARLDILWKLKSIYEDSIPHSTKALDLASEFGHSEIIKWWFDYYQEKFGQDWPNYIKDKYTIHAMDSASKNGHLTVLELWLHSKLECKYSHKALIDASNNQRIDVLNWWKNSGLELNIHHKVLDDISESGYGEVLIWWIDFYKHKIKPYDIYYSAFPLLSATIQGHIHILEMWKQSNLELYFVRDIMDYVKINAVSTLNWWLNSGLPISYSSQAINLASMHGNIEVLEWWKNSNLPLKYNNLAVNYASYYNNIGVLEWWKNSGLTIKYDSNAIYYATINSHIGVLEWWKNSGLDLGLKCID